MDLMHLLPNSKQLFLKFSIYHKVMVKSLLKPPFVIQNLSSSSNGSQIEFRLFKISCENTYYKLHKCQKSFLSFWEHICIFFVCNYIYFFIKIYSNSPQYKKRIIYLYSILFLGLSSTKICKNIVNFFIKKLTWSRP